MGVRALEFPLKHDQMRPHLNPIGKVVAMLLRPRARLTVAATVVCREGIRVL